MQVERQDKNTSLICVNKNKMKIGKNEKNKDFINGNENENEKYQKN